ncbi:MAG TPA: Ppx/GppA phosphatase family protein [Blastocatellia bacterium]|nr:Ppx/GppA phosphatase family protein [Blastocatellia bacterium]
MKLAAIDIGSNSIHLVIVQATPGQHPEIIDREKEMVRLGAGTLREHRLSRDTMDRAISTLRRFKKMAEGNKADLIITTATSAVRESHNADDFVDRVRRETGLDVQVLPGVEEARLIALAVAEVTDFNNRKALILDIGGGSTEFIVTSGGEPELLLSVRVGAVRLTEKFITTDPISSQERERLVANIRTDLTRAAWEVRQAGFDFVIGTAGTILNMADAIVHSESPNGVRSRTGIEPFSETVKLDQIRRLNQRLRSMPLRKRRKVAGIEKGRADIIIAGGQLLECIMTELGASEITTCDWSLREGVLLNYLRSNEGQEAIRSSQRSSEDALLDLSVDESKLDVRSRSVLSVARRYGYDAPHSHHVARLAAGLFDGTRRLHKLGADERRLLEHAALLHDIGYHIAHNNHHRHAAYLIKNSEMPGFTAAELAMMAALVRYHRGSMPPSPKSKRATREHDDFFALDRHQRSSFAKLAAMLQIADGLDRAHRRAVDSIRCEATSKGVTVEVYGEGEFDLEVWSAERKGGWFRLAFGVPITLVRKQLPAEAREAVSGVRA